MPTIPPPPPVFKSVAQLNFPVPKSQTTLSVDASQSVSNPPSLSGSQKAEAETNPNASKFVVTEAVPGAIKTFGTERVTAPLAPPSVTVI